MNVRNENADLVQVNARKALHGVSQTLLIPLYARAHARRLLPRVNFEDQTALALTTTLPYSLRDVSRDHFPMRLCVARTLYLEQALRRLLQASPGRTVVLFACGLDTLPQRFNTANVRWICADLEPVMELREQLLPPEDTITHTTVVLPEQIHTVAPLLQGSPPILILEGILPYLPPEQVSRCFHELIEACPQGADILVDSYHPALLAFAQWGATFKRMQTTFHFGLNHPQEYTSFSPRLIHEASWDLLPLLPWYVRKRCFLPRLLAGKLPLSTICHLSIAPVSSGSYAR